MTGETEDLDGNHAPWSLVVSIEANGHRYLRDLVAAPLDGQRRLMLGPVLPVVAMTLAEVRELCNRYRIEIVQSAMDFRAALLRDGVPNVPESWEVGALSNDRSTGVCIWEFGPEPGSF